MDNKGSSVVFRHENEEFVLQNGQIVLNRYYLEFNGEKVVDFITKLNHRHVRMFFEFLQQGTIPDLFEDQVQVFQLFKEWDCHFTVFLSFRFLIQSQPKNGLIIHQNINYPVNFGCFYFHSSVFQEFLANNPHGVFVINHDCSAKSILVFLDFLHCLIKQPELRDAGEVLELCSFLGCSSLIALINENSPDLILSNVLRKQHEDSFDFSFYENTIVNNLEIFLSLNCFGQVCIPFLVRIFQKSHTVFPISLLLPFLQNCVSFHGAKASILLSMIRFQPGNDLEDLTQFQLVFSDNESDDFFCINKNHLNKLSERYEQAQQIICEMKRKEAEDKKRIEELTKRLFEFEKHQHEIDKIKSEEEEQGIQEEQERKKKEERKIQEEYERIDNWKLIKAPDFEENIFIAAANGKITSIVYLLANGTNVNEKYQKDENYDGLGMKNSTPLHFSSRYGQLSVTEYLVNQGADKNAHGNEIDFLNIILLLSIMQQYMDSSLLLNILLIKELISIEKQIMFRCFFSKYTSSYSFKIWIS